MWRAMDDAARRQLVGSPEFSFGYYRGFGDLFSVRFREGKVYRVDHASK